LVTLQGDAEGGSKDLNGKHGREGEEKVLKILYHEREREKRWYKKKESNRGV